MFSEDEMAAYEEVVQGKLGAIRDHIDMELANLRTEQATKIEEQNNKIDTLRADMSQQVTDAKEALQSNIDSVNMDLLGEIRKVDQSTQSLMNSIREMQDQLTRSSDLMKETVDSVLVKVEAHDKMLWEKFSSSTVQTLNTQVPSVPIVPPAVNPAINVAVPVYPNPLYNPNPYFNSMVPSVHPPPVFVGPPPYHPQTVHSSPINPNSSSQSASQVAGDSVCHSSSRDISQLSSPLYDSDQTPLKEVVGPTKSSTMHFEGAADSQKPLGVGNDGGGDGDDGNGDVGGRWGQQNYGPRRNDQRGVSRDLLDRDHRDNRRHHDRHRRHGNNYYGHDQNQGDRNQNQGDQNQNQDDQNQGNDQWQYPYYDPYGYYDYYQWPGYGHPPNYRDRHHYDDDPPHDMIIEIIGEILMIPLHVKIIIVGIEETT